MNWVDLILLGVFALFGLRGFFRGFFREFFSLAGLFAGFMVAVAYDQEIAALVSKYWQMSPLLLKGISFVAVFFVVYFLLNLAGWLLHRSESLLFIKSLNRAGGLLVGLGKGAAIPALVVFFSAGAGSVFKANTENSHGSYLLPPLSRFAEGIIRLGKQQLLTRLNGDEAAPTHRL